MKKYTLLLAACIGIVFGTHSAATAQIVGSECYLQGAFLEIGMSGNATMGGTASPAGYHAHPNCCTTTPVAGGALAEVYDYGHDGWAVGAPAYMGDYTYPGSPFEGWELQVNGLHSQAFNGSGFTAGLGLTGAITGYTNTGGSAKAMWDGTALGGQMVINIETRLDTNASWVMTTVKMHNTGATPLTGVYYLRTCDPDIDASWTGGSFSTNNSITYQDDAMHRVLVSGRGTLSTAYYFGLCATDSRAKAFVYSAWPLSSAVDLSTIASGTFPATYTVGVSSYGDNAFGLLYNLGDIAAGDSAVLTYSYIFADTTNIDTVSTSLCGGPLVEGTVAAASTTACPASLVSLSLSGSSSYATTLFQWQSSPDNTTWTDIPGATTATYSMSGLVADTYFRCELTCSASGETVATPGQLISFTAICPCPTMTAGTVAANVTTACPSTAITLDDIGYTSSGVTYQWQSSADNVSWGDITGATTVPYSFTGITADTYYRLVVNCPLGTSVASASQLISYTATCGCVVAGGTVFPSVTTACPTTVITLNDAGYTTGGTTQWQASLDSAAWVNIPGTTVPYTFSGMIATTWYRLMVTCTDGSGTFAVSPGKRINFNPACSGGTTGVAPAALTTGTMLFPNPAKDELTIVTGQTGYTSYTITNGVGQEMIKAALSGSQVKVNVRGLPAGVYYVTLRGTAGTRVEKLEKW